MIVGLNTGSWLLPLMYPPEGVEPVIQPAVSNPESVASSFQIFGYVLMVTAAVLLLLKLKRAFIIKLVLSLAFFIGMTMSLTSFIGGLGLLAALVLIVFFYYRKNSLFFLNMTMTFAIAGVGGWLGASLSIIPAFIFVFLLSAYDIIAVFVTKHMVTIAEESKDKLPMMFLVPYEDKNIGIGTGDMALPLTFTVSVLKDYGPGYAIPTALGGLLGLVWLFYYIQGKRKVVLPALPPITAGLLSAFGFCWLVYGFT
jgi:presenilin-like A22 family membrane protease